MITFKCIINGILLKQSDYTTTGNNTITLTDAADSADEVRIIAYDTYSQRVSLDDYHYTADSGQTVFSGTDDDGNTLSFAPSNLQVHLNGILLRPGNDYTTTGSTSVTLVSGADSGDAVTITAISGDSAGYVPIITGLVDSAYINARVTIPEAGVDSASVLSIVTADGFTKYDSADTLGLIDSAYVQARQITYSTADFTDSAYVTAQINALIDGAPGTLNTLNEIAAALNDDDSAYATLVTLIGTKTDFDSADAITLIDSAYVNGIITGSDLDMGTNKILYSNVYDSIGALPNASSYHGMFAHVHATGAAYFAHAGSWVQLANNSSIPTNNNQLTNGAGYTTYADADVISLVDSAYINARVDAVAGTDSAATIALIQATVDSAYVAAREANAGGSGGLDSASIINLIDSAYVQARQASSSASTSSTMVTFYEYLPDSGATTISGNDRDGNALSYQTGNIQVYRNGILLVDSNDYTANNGSTVTLTTSAVGGDYISIASYVEGVDVQIKDYEFTADSGQTTFTGLATNGETLSYTADNIIVHLNGILLTDSADYTATNGSSIVLTTAADSADLLSIIAFTNTSAVNQYVEATTNITAIAGKKYIIDTSSTVTITLPSLPSFGDEVKLIDGTGNAGTNNITINRNSNKILGVDSDFTLDVDRAAIDLVYYNVTQGWIVSGNN
jgi:hypothetical protein